MCYIIKCYEMELGLLYLRWKVQLLQFDMNDGDKCEGEMVGLICVWCGGVVVILEVYGEVIIQGNDFIEEDVLVILVNV